MLMTGRKTLNNNGIILTRTATTYLLYYYNLIIKKNLMKHIFLCYKSNAFTVAHNMFRPGISSSG